MHWGALLVSALPLDESQIARAAEEMIAEYGARSATQKVMPNSIFINVSQKRRKCWACKRLR
jgi:cell division protein FtsB